MTEAERSTVEKEQVTCLSAAQTESDRTWSDHWQEGSWRPWPKFNGRMAEEGVGCETDAGEAGCLIHSRRHGSELGAECSVLRITRVVNISRRTHFGVEETFCFEDRWV